MFETKVESKLSNEYLNNGYIIREADDSLALEWIRNQFDRLIKELLPETKDINTEKLLNNIHKYISASELNDFRLEIIRSINSIEKFREMYFLVARSYLESLVGNELSMQLRVNLSIQLPNDGSSLLPIHSDVWSGDSPFEVVVWMPLVNCYKSKSMYILPSEKYAEFHKEFKNNTSSDSEELFQNIKKQIQWLDVSYGKILIFDQGLPHGNRVNEEIETRWSLNCRFKSVFTPYGDKKIGEFFEPITLKAASKKGMTYELPEIS